jgi:hypothetical protein
MIVTIDTDYSVPDPQVVYATNEEYLQFVLSRAAESYMNQYSTASKDDGITAARLAYNATIPQTEE